MRPATELAISFGTIFGTLLLVLVLVFARFKFRNHLKGRAVPVDRVHEDEISKEVDRENGSEKRWFGGRWGLTPIAKPGKGGTKQYLSGWFALDAPTHIGWTCDDDDPTRREGPDSNLGIMRESHFSRASRAVKRLQPKKVPRQSRTTQLAIIEQNDELDHTELDGNENRSRSRDKQPGRVYEKLSIAESPGSL